MVTFLTAATYRYRNKKKTMLADDDDPSANPAFISLKCLSTPCVFLVISIIERHSDLCPAVSTTDAEVEVPLCCKPKRFPVLCLEKVRIQL